jgi:hypothetical protein
VEAVYREGSRLGMNLASTLGAMAVNLSELAISGPLSSVRTRHLFTMKLEVSAVVPVGQTPNGLRRVGIVSGGSIVGDRVNGKVITGNDWQVLRPDGSLTLDVRLVLETDQGLSMTMAYRGLRHGPADVIQRLERGEAVDPTSYYFRIAPQFETSGAELGWLNGVQAIGLGHRYADGPVYVVFEVL